MLIQTPSLSFSPSRERLAGSRCLFVSRSLVRWQPLWWQRVRFETVNASVPNFSRPKTAVITFALQLAQQRVSAGHPLQIAEQLEAVE
mmetsp:Transcript_2588/g.5963  ORF Transcript_2588/g.5963 Transcript_2588/m.5963 type:complete len:88 (-) Transcript_2588:303-566(-)